MYTRVLHIKQVTDCLLSVVVVVVAVTRDTLNMCVHMNARMNKWAFGLLFSVCCWHRENGVVLVVSFAIFISTRPDFRDFLTSIRSVQNYNRFLVYLTIYRSIEI